MRRLVNNPNRDYHGGALMIAIDVGAMIQCREYPVGTLSRMGPGVFPVVLGAILAVSLHVPLRAVLHRHRRLQHQ